MRRNSFIYCAVCSFSILVLAGCVSVQNSPSARFYALQAISESQVSQKTEVAPDMVIGLSPVRIPEYQNRPQIVTKSKDNTIMFAQFDRWGESLDLALTRVISEDLRIMLPGASIEMYPWNAAIALKFQVIIDVVQLESELEKEMFFAAQWSVVDARDKKVLARKRSELRREITPHTYAGLVKTLSDVCVSLSAEISEALASLSKTNEN